MSERLTDDQLADVIARIEHGLCAECDGDSFHDGSACVACDGTGAFSLSTRTTLSMATELRERRAADLTEFERVQLLSLRVRLQGDDASAATLALLDKLIAAGGAK